VDGLIQEGGVEVVVDVLVAEATGGAASADVGPVVVMVGDVEVACVYLAEGVTVADEGGLLFSISILR